MYDTEKSLIEAFKEHLECTNSPLRLRGLAEEFDYMNGRTDIIASNEKNELLAFEAKLKKWKEALGQAYRNSSFAEYSYVVIPESIAHRAVKSKLEFSRRGIGLISVSPNGIEIVLESRHRKPLQPWLRE